MKIRIKFSKHGNTRFVGHLDIMRYFQKAMRRADIPIKYSEGFSPHQIMSFAAPLGIGLESDAEFLDIETTEALDADEAVKRLNAVMCPGIEVLEWKQLPDDAKTAMSQVESADYLVLCENVTPEMLKKLDDGEILIDKENKKGEIKQVDIKPMIYDIKTVDGGIFMHVAQGSAANLKPETVMDYLGIVEFHVIRKAVYGPNHVSL